MDQKAILGTLFAILMISILFTPAHSEAWKIPFFFGLIFGVLWYFKS